jgi:hypothetical protein
MPQHTDPSEPINVQRAEWAKAALAVFTAETYSGDHPDTMHPGDLESAIGDLICDLLNLARYHARLDAAAIHSHALDMFETELAEDEFIKAAAAFAQAEGNNSAKPVPDWLGALLNIKRLAEKSGDHEADPFALLDLIASEAFAAINKATQPQE